MSCVAFPGHLPVTCVRRFSYVIILILFSVSKAQDLPRVENGRNAPRFLMDRWLFNLHSSHTDAIPDGFQTESSYGAQESQPPSYTSGTEYPNAGLLEQLTNIIIPHEAVTNIINEGLESASVHLQSTQDSVVDADSLQTDSTSHADPPTSETTVSDPPVDGTVQLQGGSVEGTGNVFIYKEGEWGAVCDDGWNIHSSHIVCRQLGYSRALGATTNAYFGQPQHGIMLDNVQCFGDEGNLLACRTAGWGQHDCSNAEAAGVFCAPKVESDESTTTSPTSAPSTLPTQPLPPVRSNESPAESASRINELRHQGLKALHIDTDHDAVAKPLAYRMRLKGGRNPKEGRLEVLLEGATAYGAVCSDVWTLKEATVACRQLNMGFAQMAVIGTAFGGERLDKVLAGIKCEGHEQNLFDCFHEQNHMVTCPEKTMIAGVICTDSLPDLVPNGTMLEVSTYLDDVPMAYLTCAMEEGCASASAYRIKKRYRDWGQQRRRLMRFSSSTWNFGTADFRPFINKEMWDWHQCHMHYHSMEVFANYDVLDFHGNRVAEGHKASFCLEDVECMPGASKRYECVGYSDQGISVGCADNYLHSIDCQWVDITDLPAGKYLFRIHINPENKVPELSYDNNAATCDLEYNGYQVIVTNCAVGDGDHKPS